MNHLEYSRRRLATDVQSVLADMDDVLKAVAAQSTDMTAGARARFETAIQRARMRIADTKAVAQARTRRAMVDADLFAHQHPWRTAGVAAATGAALGALVGILSARR